MPSAAARRGRSRFAPLLALPRVIVERRIVRFVVASLVLLPPITARGQAPALPSGASVTVIDSAEIAASGARTLSELLMARVPGLSVRHRGGMEAEGAEISARGMVASRGLAPMLVIDGIFADGDQALPVPGTSATISRLDDLTPDDVQRIEVLRGPAASARYGFAGSAGVIVVTTRRGSEGAHALDVSARVGLTDVHADFPANYQITSGTPGQSCNPLLYGPPGPSCTPTTLYSWSPLDGASPFRVGRATSARAAFSGTAFGARTLAAVTAEHTGGVTADDWQSRLGLRGSLERELPGRITVSAQGSYLQRDASVPARGPSETMDNVIYRGLVGSAYNDTVGGFLLPRAPVLSFTVPEPSLVRVTSALRVGWQPLGWLTVDALAGQDRAGSSAHRLDRVRYFADTAATAAVDSTRWTSGTMHVGVDATGRLGTSLGLATYLAYDDVRARDTRFDSVSSMVTPLGLGSMTTTSQWRVLHSQDVTLRQHLSWREGLDVNAVTRWPVSRGVSAPLGLEASRSVDAALRLPAVRDGVDLRLRVAAGRAPLVSPATLGFITTPAGYVGSGNGYGGTTTTIASPIRPRRDEVEGGADASIGRRVQFQLTWFAARSSDVVVGTFVANVLRLAEISDRGVEGLASVQLVDGPRVRWRTTVTATTLRSRVTSLSGYAAPNDPYQVGYAPQGMWQQDYAWTDANADGYIEPNEVTRGSYAYAGPSAPTVEVGVRSSLTLPGALTLAALLDYRGGQYRDDQTALSRCEHLICRGLNDFSVSQEDQATAVAMVYSYNMTVPEPASFLRLREVVLDWAPAMLSRIAGGRRTSVRLVGQNLATWTRYPGIDPEVGATPDTFGVTEATDLFQGPLARRVSVELRVGARGSTP